MLPHELDRERENLRESFDIIMDNFEFEVCADVMRRMNWQYSRLIANEAKHFVPDEYELRKTVRNLFNILMKEWTGEDYGIASGRFALEIRLIKNEYRLELRFEVTNLHANWEIK